MVDRDEDLITSVTEVEDQPTYETTGLDEPESEVEGEDESGDADVQVGSVAEEVVEEESSEPDVPEYEPNYGYQANQEQKEFPDWVHDYVKDKDTEDKFREIFEKYDGFDTQKSRYEAERQERESLQAEHEKLTNGVNNLKWQLDHDPKTFFQNVGWGDQEVLNYAKQVLQYVEMSPQEKAQVDQGRETALNAHQYQQQLNLLQQQNEQMQAQQLNMQFDQALASPNVHEVASAYDQRVGRVGAFRQKATNEWNVNTSHTSPSQAINAVVDELRLFGIGQQDQQAAPATAPVTSKTLPNVGAGRATATPTQKTWGSIEEMREALAREAAEG